MPTYSFQCTACNKSFELTMTMAEHSAKKFVCPKCGSKKVRQKLSMFATSTSKHQIPKQRSKWALEREAKQAAADKVDKKKLAKKVKKKVVKSKASKSR